MAETSSIQWLSRNGINGATWNPWISCQHATYVGSDGKQHAHPGCLFCYAEDLMDTRYNKCVWGNNGNRVVTSPSYWRKPDVWNRKARNSHRLPVFPSLCDPFEDWQGPMVNASGARGFITHDRKRKWLSDEATDEGMRPMIMEDVRFDFMMLIDHTEWIDWLLFTKRPQNVRNMWPLHIATGGDRDNHRTNVTLCYSASNQETLLYGAPLVLECLDLCPVVGISLEPMLGSVNLRAIPNYQSLGWVIVGCESNGPRVGRLGDFIRESDWWDGAAFVLQQCKEAGIPAYMKQGPCNGRVIHSENEFPASCRVRQFPTMPAV